MEISTELFPFNNARHFRLIDSLLSNSSGTIREISLANSIDDRKVCLIISGHFNVPAMHLVHCAISHETHFSPCLIGSLSYMSKNILVKMVKRNTSYS